MVESARSRRIPCAAGGSQDCAPAPTPAVAGGDVTSSRQTPASAPKVFGRHCTARSLPEFPWPFPPRATDQILVPRRYIQTDGVPLKTLGDVLQLLEARIVAAGYRYPGVLGAGCNGFAIVLDVERIYEDGSRYAGADGFAGPGQHAKFTIFDVIRRLLLARPGFFRVIVLVVSDQPPTGYSSEQSLGDLRARAALAREAAPVTLRQVALTDSYEIRALVYEFEKPLSAESATLTKPLGRLPAHSHLAQARLGLGSAPMHSSR
jgi:hypothetical protein